jgi:hypothetical protein
MDSKAGRKFVGFVPSKVLALRATEAPQLAVLSHAWAKYRQAPRKQHVNIARYRA